MKLRVHLLIKSISNGNKLIGHERIPENTFLGLFISIGSNLLIAIPRLMRDFANRACPNAFDKL